MILSTRRSILAMLGLAPVLAARCAVANPVLPVAKRLSPDSVSHRCITPIRAPLLPDDVSAWRRLPLSEWTFYPSKDGRHMIVGAYEHRGSLRYSKVLGSDLSNDAETIAEYERTVFPILDSGAVVFAAAS